MEIATARQTDISVSNLGSSPEPAEQQQAKILSLDEQTQASEVQAGIEAPPTILALSEQTEITEFAKIPPTMSGAEFDGCLASCKRLGLDEQLFIDAYQKTPITGSYKLRSPLAEGLSQRLWDAYVKINESGWRDSSVIYLVANWIYQHRIMHNRIGSADDDFRKAAYLVYLVEYLDKKRATRTRLRHDSEMSEVIDKINNIFDTAYFAKINSPEKSDQECFFDAEREFCEEKDLEFFEHQTSDKDEAKKAHIQREIGLLAHKNFENRLLTGEPGDELSDWLAAEKQYQLWKAKKNIAAICWTLLADKHQSSEFYWMLACEITDHLEQANIPFLDKDPHEPKIYSVIKSIVNGQKKGNKLVELLSNIRNSKYKADSLNDLDGFQHTLAQDLKIDSLESMAMLGYLLKNEYVIVDHTGGLVINRDNPKMKQITGGEQETTFSNSPEPQLVERSHSNAQ